MFVRWLLIDVEHWLFSLLAARLGKYRPSGSGNDEFWVAGRLDTLLGPEETGECLVTSDCGTDGRAIPYGWCGFGGPGCFLRTAQWTRASLANDEISCGSWGFRVLRFAWGFVVCLRFVLIVLCVQVF